MSQEELNEALYAKMSEEQEAFKAELLQLSPEEILESAAEYLCRERIVESLEYNELTPKQASAMLRSRTPLADVYATYKRIEVDPMTALWHAVESRSNELLRRAFFDKQKGDR